MHHCRRRVMEHRNTSLQATPDTKYIPTHLELKLCQNEETRDLRSGGLESQVSRVSQNSRIRRRRVERERRCCLFWSPLPLPRSFYYPCIHIQACDNNCLKVTVDLSLRMQCIDLMRSVIGWGSVASVEKQKKKETDERLRGGGWYW